MAQEEMLSKAIQEPKITKFRPRKGPIFSFIIKNGMSIETCPDFVTQLHTNFLQTGAHPSSLLCSAEHMKSKVTSNKWLKNMFFTMFM